MLNLCPIKKFLYLKQVLLDMMLGLPMEFATVYFEYMSYCHILIVLIQKIGRLEKVKVIPLYAKKVEVSIVSPKPTLK